MHSYLVEQTRTHTHPHTHTHSLISILPRTTDDFIRARALEDFAGAAAAARL